MKVLVIFLVLIVFVGFAHAYEPEPVGVNMIEYGIFDPNDNNTHLLKVDTTYDIKAHFQSELDKQVSFKFLVQVQDKDKHWTEPVDEFIRTGTLQPNESKRFSFAWTPQYQGEFRTYVEVSNPTTNTAMGYAPQFDFEVIQPNTDDPFYDYFPTYRIMNLKDKYLIDEPIRPYILKKDLDACNAYRAEILKDDRRVWEYTTHSSCIMAVESFEIESEIQIPTTNEYIKLSEAGHYTLEIEIGSYELQESFSVEESEPTPQQITENDKKRYCDYAVERQLPTPWKYDCYDEPLANPQRDMNLGNPMLGNNLLDCNDSENASVCFKDAFDSCTPAMIKREISTVEGDSVYTGAYITDSCKIHAFFDTREDRFSSLEDRTLTQSDCSGIQFQDNKMIISNCNDLNTYEFLAKENNLQTSYSQQWLTKIILVGIILGGISAGIIIAIKLWRRKWKNTKHQKN